MPALLTGRRPELYRLYPSLRRRRNLHQPSVGLGQETRPQEALEEVQDLSFLSALSGYHTSTTAVGPVDETQSAAIPYVRGSRSAIEFHTLFERR